MKKIYTFFFILIGCPSILPAQPAGYKQIIDVEATANLAKEINSLTKETVTLQCHFTQEKSSSLLAEKAMSKGKMYYRNPADLRWEYISPKPFLFILKNGQSKQTDQNRMFQEMSRMIVQLINGAGLQDSKNYSLTYFRNDQSVWIKMTPKNKRMQAMFSVIYLIFDLKAGVAKSIEMHDTTDDITLIKFTDIRKNETLQDRLFE